MFQFDLLSMPFLDLIISEIKFPLKLLQLHIVRRLQETPSSMQLPVTHFTLQRQCPLVSSQELGGIALLELCFKQKQTKYVRD